MDRNLAVRFGESIANLHRTSNEYKSKYKRYRIDLNYLINEPIKMLQEYANKHELGDLNFFTSYEKYLSRQLQELSVNDEAYGIIHGDLNPSNIHIDNNGNITIETINLIYGLLIIHMTRSILESTALKVWLVVRKHFANIRGIKQYYV